MRQGLETIGFGLRVQGLIYFAAYKYVGCVGFLLAISIKPCILLYRLQWSGI